MSRVRVLVVDDSAFARKVVREVLSREPSIEVVGTARDGLDALQKIAELSPDVLTLDLVMPNLDGVGVLEALKGEGPRAVVVTSSAEESEVVVAALMAGAHAAVHKPTALATDRLYEIGRDLVTAVQRAAAAGRTTAAPVAPERLPAPAAGRHSLLVLGASTGGPHALTRVLTALPADLPVPVALVLHMPVGYTEAYAARLDDLCALEVVEATDGAALRPGRVIVARAGLHLRIDARGEAVRLDPEPLEALHRPSVDVLFASAAASHGAGVLAAVLTGMGDDGLAGARAVRRAGGTVLTQSAATCVVYGMPRVVDEAGLSVEQVPLEELAAAILGRL